MLAIPLGSLAPAPGSEVLERIAIGKVWTGVPVSPCLLTEGDRQYVAFYNDRRRTVVGMRSLDEDGFQLAVLPSEIDRPPRCGEPVTSTIAGWDAHNDLTLAVDRRGFIHLSGNMHVNRLTYFRSRVPHDITTLVQVRSMTGSDEDRVTYPKFMKGPDGGLIFHYRDGSSGNGREIYNRYDERSRSWSRLLDQPLTDGRGERNAYLTGPHRGPDGWYHLGWVWRETPDCATNHDPSYARSRDLVHWENAAGDALELPITLESPGTIIDPIPVGGGIINGGLKVGFDHQGRAVAGYHKFDGEGRTQAYVARFQEGRWLRRQVSDWTYRWDFGGPGSLPGWKIRLGAVHPHGPDRLAMPFSHQHHGRGLIVIDADSLEPIEVVPGKPSHPRPLSRPLSDFPGIQVNWVSDLGQPAGDPARYVLRWESLGVNRDRPKESIPEAGEILLLKLPGEDSGD